MRRISRATPAARPVAWRKTSSAPFISDRPFKKYWTVYTPCLLDFDADLPDSLCEPPA
jgi:hypothetical protein